MGIQLNMKSKKSMLMVTSHIDFNDKEFSVLITNTKDIEYTDIKGEKIWFDASGNMLDESEQTDITIELLKDGEVYTQ